MINFKRFTGTLYKLVRIISFLPQLTFILLQPQVFHFISHMKIGNVLKNYVVIPRIMPPLSSWEYQKWKISSTLFSLFLYILPFKSHKFLMCSILCSLFSILILAVLTQNLLLFSLKYNIYLFICSFTHSTNNSWTTMCHSLVQLLRTKW